MIIIRMKIKKETVLEEPENILNNNLKNKFWSTTCQEIFNKANNCLPTFNIDTCGRYFRSVVGDRVLKTFQIPGWIPKLEDPTVPYEDILPTYKEVDSVINKCRSRASPCCFDGLSIIILKRCPFLRSMLHLIIKECWIQKQIPDCWKKGATVLIYKKGPTDDPSNFRPITLQPVWYKVFATIMKRRMYEYLTQNKYLDQDIQKGFWSRLDGVTEHTELLTHIMKDSKRHSRSLVVTLLDLKNAFGEVHHNLIRESLKYHHLPDIFVDLFNSIYSDCSISVSANNQWTDPIGIKKGVLGHIQIGCVAIFSLRIIASKVTHASEIEKIATQWSKLSMRFYACVCVKNLIYFLTKDLIISLYRSKAKAIYVYSRGRSHTG